MNIIGTVNSEKKSCFKKIQDTQSKINTIASVNTYFELDLTNLCISANKLVNNRWDLLSDTVKKAINDNM